MNKPLRQVLFWTPRIAGILFILFLSMFALDVFGMEPNLWRTLAALFMHLIPSILLAIAILIAWRREWLGAVLFLGWAIFYVVSFPGSGWFAFLLIAGIPALIGLLFLAGWIWRAQIRSGR